MVTGTLDSLTRAEAEELVKRHSGRITKAVSGKTTFLVCGSNAGKTKYRLVSQGNLLHHDYVEFSNMDTILTQCKLII